jgi:cytoskeletal protein CcmA (bactofilin family)
MALFGTDRDAGKTAQPRPGTAGGAPREVEMQGTDGTPLTAFLGKGSHVTGTLVFDGPSRIEGHVEGEVSAKDTLTVAESAVVNARLTGTVIVIHGTITGDVVAQQRIEIRAPGKVTGDVTTPSLVINEGAIFEGRCSMRSGASAADGHAASAPAPTTTSQLQAG